MKTVSSSILLKLVLAFMLVALTAALIVGLVIRLTSAYRLSNLIVDQQRSMLQTALENYYGYYGSWKGIAERWVQAQSLPPNGNGYGEDDDHMDYPGRPPEGDRRLLFGLADKNGVVVVPVDPDYPVGSKLPKISKRGTPVLVDNVQVGTSSQRTFHRV